MNCDDFLDALTSSDEGRQTAARWHANSCPACAMLAELDARLKQDLGEPEPLPSRVRAVWAAAADLPSSTLARRASEGRNVDWKALPLLIAATAASLLFLIVIPVLIWRLNDHQDIVLEPRKGNPPPVTTRIAIGEIDASAALTDLLAQVNALEAELNKTSKQANLVDARREADVLLANYSNW